MTALPQMPNMAGMGGLASMANMNGMQVVMIPQGMLPQLLQSGLMGQQGLVPQLPMVMAMPSPVPSIA
eukprot:CAMPEP_0170649350 /NCGR_PEP_ID=MMETSP0224-20130122/45241_1 /TAXON_ID=285029 /ORGANISM="Togula jolla, Strain CCCM 725" /LENGTH=67 /DNA_ID=CAMNT_0010980977 /DNA_START=31 /DNA_END=231 /DNA_ORIENTATION=-